MTLLFDRKYRLIVGHQAIKIENLDIEFEVIKTLKKSANSCSIVVNGLKQSTRQSIIDAVEPPVSLFAGYKDNMSLIFIGNARDCYTSKEKTEVSTYINSGDSEINLQKKRINKTFAPGTSVITVLSEIVSALEIQPGNIGTKFSSLTLLEGSAQYTNGAVFSGNAGRELTRVCKSVGLQYSIQDNVLQVLEPNEALLEEPVVVLGDSVVGYPEIGSDNTTSFTTLMNPEIRPGRLVNLKGRMLRAENVKYSGVYPTGGNWYTEVEGRFVS